MSAPSETFGFYGKMPSRGDFVSRGLPQSFIGAWDGWMQSLLAEGQTTLGDGWLDAYLTAPIWHFTVAPGVLDEQAWAGAFMSSVDRVGRYFPIVEARSISADLGLLGCAHQLRDWFLDVEAALLWVLDQEELDLDALQMQAGERCSRWPSEAAAAAVTGIATDGRVELTGRPSDVHGLKGADRALQMSGMGALFWHYVEDELIVADFMPADRVDLAHLFYAHRPSAAD